MIRPYEEHDLGAVGDLWYRASRIAHPFLDEDFLARERVEIETVHMPKADVWVYELNGCVVGFVAMLGNEIGGLFVDPEMQRRGIGRQLVNHVRAFHDTLELEVFEENPVGRAFYAGYGFIEVGRSLHEPSGRVQLRMRHSVEENPGAEAVVRRFLDAFSAGDIEGIESVLPPAFSLSGPLYTFDSRESYLAQLRVDGLAPAPLEIETIDTEGDTVVAVYRYNGRRIRQEFVLVGGLISSTRLSF